MNEPNDWVAYVHYLTGEVLEVHRFYNPLLEGLGTREPPPEWDDKSDE